MSESQREASSGKVVQTIHLVIIFCFFFLVGYELLVLISSFWTPTTRSSVRNICVLSLSLLGYLGSVHLANRWFDDREDVDHRRPFFTWLEGGAWRWWKERQPLDRLVLRMGTDLDPAEEAGDQLPRRTAPAWLPALKWVGAFLAGQQLADSRSGLLELRMKTGPVVSDPGSPSERPGLESASLKLRGTVLSPPGRIDLASVRGGRGEQISKASSPVRAGRSEAPAQSRAAEEVKQRGGQAKPSQDASFSPGTAAAPLAARPSAQEAFLPVGYKQPAERVPTMPARPARGHRGRRIIRAFVFKPLSRGRSG